MKGPAKITRSDWEWLLEQAVSTDVIPDGALTFTQLQEKWNVGESGARGKIKILLEKKLVEKKLFRVNGRQVMHFLKVRSKT